MDITLRDLNDRKTKSKIQLSDDVFGCQYNEGLVHQAVQHNVLKRHIGTKAQKNRSDVRGGGAKPWRQKGTGRARAGTNRSPLWRGGGIIFASRPLLKQSKLNRKMLKNAFRSTLSELVRLDRFHVVEKLEQESPKTKDLYNKLKENNLTNVLFIADSVEHNFELATRNIPNVSVMSTASVDIVDLLNSSVVVATQEAVKKYEEWLQ